MERVSFFIGGFLECLSSQPRHIGTIRPLKCALPCQCGAKTLQAYMRDWDDHRLILALHRHGTLRATGDALGVTHTTIARRLAALDAIEPTALFTRQDGAYRVTEYGKERAALAERIEALDHSATRIQRSADSGLSGPLSLSIPQAVFQYLLVDAIGDFAKLHPDIDLTVVGTDRLADLDRGEADVVIRGQANPPDHLVGREICTVGLSEYGHIDYLEATNADNRHWLSSTADPDWLATTSHPKAPIGYVIHDISSRHLALKHGQGLSRAACFMADQIPELVRLNNDPATPLYGLWVLTHPDLRASPKVMALMKAMSAALVEQRDLIRG
ncbi:MAG: LysR family transcriptional regulator [Litorimonas sp.]